MPTQTTFESSHGEHNQQQSTLSSFDSIGGGDEETGIFNNRMLKKASRRNHRHKNKKQGKNKLGVAKSTLHWRHVRATLEEENDSDGDKDTTFVEKNNDEDSNDKNEVNNDYDEVQQQQQDRGGRKKRRGRRSSSKASASVSQTSTSSPSFSSSSSTFVCPCGKPNSRDCRRQRCSYARANAIQNQETVVRTSRAIERRKKKEQRKVRLEAYLQRKEEAVEQQTKKLQRLQEKAVGISKTVAENKARESINKVQESVKQVGKQQDMHRQTLRAQQSGAFRKGRETAASIGYHIPILSADVPISTSTHWFEPLVSSTDRVASAVDNLVPVKAYSNKEDTCAICACELLEDNEGENVCGKEDKDEVVYIRTCSVKHFFHRSCISNSFAYNTQCPTCLKPVVPITGPQPDGTMTVHVNKNTTCPGHERTSNGTIVISYNFPSGKQDDRHPNPSQFFSGTRRVAYLPNNSSGRSVLALMQLAFDRRLLFRVGTSLTTGASNTVIWNSIHHKTVVFGGMFGYPDATYLERVAEELNAALRL
eukprot:m.13786 g.13786  ORF g.13786 m.13786 type:complete len:536 (+) comp7632_c0_seq1:55-1662(+)